MTLEPLGDRAALATFPNEEQAVAWAGQLHGLAPAWLLDVVPAYLTVGVFFDPGLIRLPDILVWLAGQTLTAATASQQPPRRWRVPVCYERGPDLAAVAKQTGLTSEGVIAAHLGSEYRVYAVGFAPGFAYLGYLPPQLGGVPRLASPRVRVEPGSVGVTGRQTAVYPLPRPGGWPLIGRTPRVVVDVAAGYFPFEVGDRVAFARIDEAEFTRQAGERLAESEGVSPC